jgi:hypothetical protein
VTGISRQAPVTLLIADSSAAAEDGVADLVDCSVCSAGITGMVISDGAGPMVGVKTGVGVKANGVFGCPESC